MIEDLHFNEVKLRLKMDKIRRAEEQEIRDIVR